MPKTRWFGKYLSEYPQLKERGRPKPLWNGGEKATISSEDLQITDGEVSSEMLNKL